MIQACWPSRRCCVTHRRHHDREPTPSQPVLVSPPGLVPAVACRRCGLRSGAVRYFDESKGFGFIKDKDSQMEFFFHFSSADFPIAQHDLVTFDTEMGMKGVNAVRITKLDPNKPVVVKPAVINDAGASTMVSLPASINDQVSKP